MVVVVVFESSTRADQYGREREKESEKEKRLVFSLSIIAHNIKITRTESFNSSFFLREQKNGKRPLSKNVLG